MYIGQQWFSKRTTIPIYEETEFDKQLYKQTLKPEQTKIAPRYLSLNLVIVPNLLFVQMYFLSATKQQLPLFYFATPPPTAIFFFLFILTPLNRDAIVWRFPRFQENLSNPICAKINLQDFAPNRKNILRIIATKFSG